MEVSGDQLSQRVLQAVAAVENVEPTDLPLLYEVVDPDALDALFQPADNGQSTVGSVKFEYAEHTVVVQSDGTIHVDGSATHDTDWNTR